MTSLGNFVEIFLQALTAGILVGAIYGLMCVGLGIIFGVMRVINFAQGEFLMLGMYFTFYVVAGVNLLSVPGPVHWALYRCPACGTGAVRRGLRPASIPHFACDRRQRRRHRG